MNEVIAQVLDFPEQGLSKDSGPYRASPQVEDGHVRIANELFDAILQAGLGKREWAVLMAVIRKTYGYGKKADDLSSSQIARLTGLDSGHCRRALAGLAKRNILHVSPGAYGKVVEINKDYTQWGACQNSTPRAKSAQEPVPKQHGSPCQIGTHNNQPQKPTPNTPSSEGAPPPQTPSLIGQAEEVTDYLNRRAGKAFKARNPKGQPTKNANHIMARLKEGYSVTDCQEVVDNRIRAWSGDAKMAEFIRPQTLFNSEKFEAYLGDAQSKTADSGPGLQEL